ncbi:MAG TPA: nucleoside-diphosphate sugar epimerase/dehydratase [Gemmatimonadales bacterium]|nr:nucleoside-diphosphate sugar epimerase/dehydratase [Gemmatimonadales bacterium]
MEIRNRYLILGDTALLTVALFVSFALRFEGWSWDPLTTRTAVVYAAVSVPVTIAIFYGTGLYQRLWRYASASDLERIVFGGFIAGLVCVPIGFIVLPAAGLAATGVPLSVLGMSWVFGIAVPAVPRWAMRVSHRQQPRRRRSDDRRVIIAGAGAAGGMIARELRQNPQLGIDPVGFVDDNRRKHGHCLNDLPVLGSLADLPGIIQRLRIREVVIAMPTASGKVIRGVVESARAAGSKTLTVPGIYEILAGRKSVTALREVEIQDLLRREPVTTDLAAVGTLARGRTVLVTGAGGSIGSELCRQLAELKPARLILLGHGENSIFTVQQELSVRFPDLSMTPVICDIRDRARLAEVFRRYRPHALFHAAAHKHVPLMEDNVADAITNNILGTRNIAEVSAGSGVEHFVLISSDKAVRPTSVMGACKRAAEQIVQEVAERTGRHYVAVRFGNVLGSRGSVVPTFLAQIAAGGPVTVTDPDMRRYFMTIPEAVQLVLQAGALGRGGEVFVLDMGEPVKIVDLARDLIRLSGLQVDTDIEIAFTGLRPGEKLYEELFFDSERAIPTSHPKILRATNAEIPSGLVALRTDLINAVLDGRDDAELRAHLARLVPDYTLPPAPIHTLMEDGRIGVTAPAETADTAA